MISWAQQQRAKWSALIRDREVFIRTDGDIKFLTISAKFQKRMVVLIAFALSLWVVATVGMAGYQFATSGDRALLASRAAKVQAQEARVKAYKAQFANEAERLDARQNQLEGMFRDHFGSDGKSVTAQTTPVEGARKGSVSVEIKDTPLSFTSDRSGNVPTLSAIDSRQRGFAKRLLGVVEARAARAELAIRDLGLNPASIGSGTEGTGGPFIPAKAATRLKYDPALDTLANALARMETLERALLAMPLGLPADVMTMSSDYGYRHDPFTGAGAFHAGIDFKGPVGTAIFAASSGTVSFAGVQSGYGNVVEIDHGHGIITRYAHLSAIDVALGSAVKGGMPIARMGSTGRSTGSHLHFEVRINGTAVDPRRFLEAKDNVLKIKDLAGQRVSSVGGGL
jgi:murein DD-endopeptidase MepM/ murein hydrolase activator NlpD